VKRDKCFERVKKLNLGSEQESQLQKHLERMRFIEALIIEYRQRLPTIL